MLLKNGILKRVIHDPNGKEEGYNFESGHLLTLIEYANEHPEEFLRVLNKKPGRQFTNFIGDLNKEVGEER